jgi:hypothetical protein
MFGWSWLKDGDGHQDFCFVDWMVPKNEVSQRCTRRWPPRPTVLAGWVHPRSRPNIPLWWPSSPSCLPTKQVKNHGHHLPSNLSQSTKHTLRITPRVRTNLSKNKLEQEQHWNQSNHKRQKICSWSSANHESCLHLRWGVHKGPCLSRPQTSPNDHQDLVWFSTIKFPRTRGQYKLFEIHNNLGNSQRTPSLSRGQVCKSNEHTEVIGEVLCLKIERVTQRMAQISLRKLGLEWSLREREFELKKCWFKKFSSQRSGQTS